MTDKSNDASLAKLLAAVEAIQAFASIHGVRDLVISRCDEDHAIQNPGFRHPLPHVVSLKPPNLAQDFDLVLYVRLN